MLSKHKHNMATLHMLRKKSAMSTFISDIKTPYLYNTFMFLNMVQFSIENHSIKTATSDLNSNLKIFG